MIYSRLWRTCPVLIMLGACSYFSKAEQTSTPPLESPTPRPLLEVTWVVTASPNARATSTPRPEVPKPSPFAENGPVMAGCPVFPTDHIWNTPIDQAPVDRHSKDYIEAIGADTGLHPDFGSGLYDGGPIGIPISVADSSTPRSQVTFDYSDESDAGPYPIPTDAQIEGGSQSDGDRHILIVEKDQCKLYELYAAYPNADGSWQAGSGAIWDLKGYQLRPPDWTSADAAGLSILPGLVRYDEVAAGEIRHALRFTAQNTQRAYLWPARHQASDDSNINLPPMGQRFRLRASFDVSPFPPEVRVILKAMQTYGLILADNGSNWFVSGEPDDRWNNDTLVESFRQVHGSDFEAVVASGFMRDSNSGQATPP